MSRWLPLAASAHAGEIDFILSLVHGLMLVLFVGWAIYFGWVLIRFRRTRQPRADYRGATGRFATWSEFGVVVAEGALLVVFALPAWFTRTSAPPPDPRALVVRVVAEQYAWNVHYPGADGRFGETAVRFVSPTNPIGVDRSSPFGQDDIVTVNQLHVPIGRQVVVQLSSKDVIHSFGLPNFRVKQDVIPGMLSTVWFTPTVEGEFDIACSQLCGLGHYRMRGTVVVESEAAFAKFLTEETANIGR
jgi:cytochrome c oxidase subunit 2